MGVVKGDKIIATELFDQLADSGWETLASITNRSFLEEYHEKEGYFWLRCDPDLYTYIAYNSGTTYDTGDRINSATYVWESLEDGNIGNTPAENTHWTRKWKLDSSTGNWSNIRFEGDGGGTSKSYFDLWKVTWIEGVEQLDLVEAQNEFGQAIYGKEPGYYKYNIATRTFLWGKATTTLKVKRLDNNIAKDDLIRVMAVDFKELLDYGLTQLTAGLAAGGRFSSENYLGGDYEGT